jgi:hypothetical protein
MIKLIKSQFTLLSFILLLLISSGSGNRLLAQIDTNKIIIEPEDKGIQFNDTTTTVNPIPDRILTADTTRPVGVRQKFTYLFKEDKNDPTSWSHFKINAKVYDDSAFIQMQQELLISPPLESFIVSVNLTDPNAQYVTIGEEGQEGSKQYSWDMLSPKTQMALVKWKGANKENLTKTGYNFASVFTEAIRKVRIDEFVSPPQREREIVNSIAYINPYFNFFGADPLGIPLKRGFGFSFQSGTPYSGPLETDFVGANFHLLGASVGVTSRLKELVLKRETGATKGEKSGRFGKYNNLYGPKMGLSFNYVLPFGNFFQIGYFTVLDSGDYDPPIQIKKDNDSTFMPNHNIIDGGWFNWEFRYPIRIFRSTRSKIYIAQYLGEVNAGFLGRELTLAGSVFDLRINATFGSAVRNFQLLLEAYVSSIGEGFSSTAFAIGPSVRLTKTPSGRLGVVTVLVNARLKIGDFFDEK